MRGLLQYFFSIGYTIFFSAHIELRKEVYLYVPGRIPTGYCQLYWKCFKTDWSLEPSGLERNRKTIWKRDEEKTVDFRRRSLQILQDNSWLQSELRACMGQVQIFGFQTKIWLFDRRKTSQPQMLPCSFPLPALATRSDESWVNTINKLSLDLFLRPKLCEIPWKTCREVQERS